MSMIRELPTIWHVLLGIVIIVTLGVGAIIGLLIVRKEEGQIERADKEEVERLSKEGG